MCIGRRVVKALLWVFILCLSIMGGGLFFAYSYITDSETAAKLIREQAVRYFPTATLEPGRVRVRPFAGEVVIRDLKLRQPIDSSFLEVLRIPWLHVQIDARKLADGQLEAREIVLVQPTLRLRRRRNGTWNLEGLIADPWPVPWISTPPIVIRDATLELIPEEEPASSSGTPAPSLSRAGNPSPSSTSNQPVAAPAASQIPLPLAPARATSGNSRGAAILRDVALKIEEVGAGSSVLRFDGSARGDVFDRLALNGTIDLNTGSITLGGQLSGLNLSESLRRRIPREAQPFVTALALNSGLVDLELHQFRYNPAALAQSRLRYQAVARLREGVWECPHLPFPIDNLSALVTAEDGVLTLSHVQGTNGQTTLRAEGIIALQEPKHMPMDLRVELSDLPLDARLRKWTPTEHDELWDVFKPRGRVDAVLQVVRPDATAPIGCSATVVCRDVSAEYRHFPYPLDHLIGRLNLEADILTVDLHTLIGGKDVHLEGTIQDPGEDAVVKLDIRADSVPIDDTIKKAIPPDARKVVEQFNPSGFVKLHAAVFREPIFGPGALPAGHLEINAEIDLNERCEITWEGLPYPVRNLTGRLEVHPDNWTFREMRGRNGQATISASGSVQKVPGPKLPNGVDPLKIDVFLKADNLPFDGELHSALPKAWKKTWPTINPSGASDIEAEVHVAPGLPQHTHILIVPRRESNVRLEVTRTPQPGIDPGGTIDLPMENVRGRFVFDDGKVSMRDVGFMFRGGPVKFSKGAVFLEDSGRFLLNVNDLEVDAIRFDPDLRNKMPPLMSQFALRLDDGHTFRARGNLQIGWSGVEGDLAWCEWKNALVVFHDNTVKTGIPLEHIQGQLDHVSGRSNGRSLQVEGIMRLESISLLGQQITRLESPFEVKNGVAQLKSVKGRFLGGNLLAEDACWIELDAAPRYHAAMSLAGAELQEYARTISGRQPYRGEINARIELNGKGSDIRNLYGGGEAHITRGDLGELPAVLRIAKVLNSLPNINLTPAERPRSPGKTAFDSADVAFTISHGLTTFDPIKFTGNAFSLLGDGTMNPQGILDLRLNVLWGRDRFHFPIVSDVTREVSNRFFIVRVQGTPSSHQIVPEALPLFSELLRALGRNRVEAQSQ
jgi:hypothetical protein